MTAAPQYNEAQIKAYLERIGIDHVLEPTVSYLDELVLAHQLAVPFENIDVYELGIATSNDVNALFDKIVVRKRGGYCFELNGAFAALLRGLGYNVQPSAARVIITGRPDRPISHRCNLVHIDDERYVVDVGFGGPMAPFALKVEDGFSKTGCGQSFSVHTFDAYWFDIQYDTSANGPLPVTRFCTMPLFDYDFDAFTYNQSKNPESPFARELSVNLRTTAGSRNIKGTVYTEHINGTATTQDIADDDMRDALLAEKFGIVNWH